jgi:general secretion pathway protein D
MFHQALSRLCKQALLGIGLTALAAQASHANPTLGISGPDAPVRYGDTITLQITASDLVDLYAYQFTMHFNPAVFQAMSVNEGPFLQGGGETFFDRGTMDNTAGEVSFVLGTLIGPQPGVSGDGVLGTLQFRVVTMAPTPELFSLTDVLAVNSALQEITLQTGTFTNAVPEPATSLLMASALAALGGLVLHRRRREAAALQAF